MKILKIKKLFLLISLIFFLPVFSNNDQKIIDTVKQTFNTDMPGLQSTLNSKNSGAIFELETGLFFQKELNENIIGFSLDIIFLYKDINKHFAYIKNKKNKKPTPLELITTEYDVVTESRVIECKMGKKNPKKKILKQLNKEKNILLFFKELKKELEKKKLEISFELIKKKKSYCKVTINGKLTKNKNISFTSKWLNGSDIETCIKQFNIILEILSSSSLLVAFKYTISPSLNDSLKTQSLKYKEKINIEIADTKSLLKKIITAPINSLCNMFSKLKVCTT